MKYIRGLVVITLALVTLTLTLGINACGDSNADTVSQNISDEAEKFKVGRRIVVTNGITGKDVYRIEGRCSFEDKSDRIDVVCRDKTSGPKNRQFTKASVHLGDQDEWASVQLGPISVSEYRTKIIIRPEAIVPDFDLVTGDQVPPSER